MRGVVVSAAGTGAGKTLIARALALALRRRGRRVQPYKIGPDYIDGRLAARAGGRPCYNVDLWLDGEDGARAHVAGTLGDADVAVFEGMMGLHDGDDLGATSTAGVARVLDIPVLLVLDGWSASQTLAAIAAGLRDYDPQVRFAGAILNRCGGGAHERAVRDACARAGIAVAGTIAYDPELATAERHLGVDVADAERRWSALERLGERLAGDLDLDGLTGPLDVPAASVPAAPAPRARIAVAEDEAFWFTYPETLIALRAAGAEVVPFSPLHDAALPAGVRGLWLGGGYPEDHAAALAANGTMRRAIGDAVRSGLPVYAECGGLMYLCDELRTREGTYPMAGGVTGRADIAEPRLTIGYRAARTLHATPLDAAGAVLRGYEFRYATATLEGPPAYGYDDGQAPDGTASATLCASFLHRHFRAGDPAIARFVETCAR